MLSVDFEVVLRPILMCDTYGEWRYVASELRVGYKG